MPTVSVIISTHNRVEFLPRAIESAKNASRDCEIIVADDASTDGTAEFCSHRTDIRYVRLDGHKGVGAVRNAGIRESSGEFISFHDDDDVRFPGSIDREVRLLVDNPKAGLAYGPILHGDQDCNPTDIVDPKETPQGDLFWQLLEWYFLPTLSIVFRRSCLEHTGMLDESIPGFDEWALCVRIAENHEVVATAEPIGIWRIATPSSGQYSSRFAELWKVFARHQLELMKLPRAVANPNKCREVRKATLARMSDGLIWDADKWLRNGATERARNSILTALRMNPLRASRLWTFKLLYESLKSRPDKVVTESRMSN